MQSSNRKLGTFEGVFTPSILTILGVIMYLRLGWVVGNAGLGGALLIILLAKLVTVTTGLSIASIASNVKVGAGGSYAFISRSLGLEVGSAIGIPLYLSQALGGAMYVTGYTEGWLAIFPAHDPLTVSTVVLILLLAVSLIGAKFAMRSQFIIMAILVLSLLSFFLGRGPMTAEITLWGDFSAAPFWTVFAIFFPAVTGIEAGAAMSGDLKDSRKSLPLGTLSAIGVSLVVYTAVAFWLEHLATPEELVGNYTIMMSVARWRWLIVAGVLGATLSSALGSVVGAPRTLMALGQDKVIPFYKLFGKRTKKGEPVFATIFTALFIEIALILGDLNSIAPLLTMFFLITYGTLNLAVVIEKGIGIPSFRPSFNIPIIIPLIGAIWCLAIMFRINPVFAAAALVLIFLFYIIQVKRGLRTPWGDVRRGLFLAIAEWAAKVSAQMPRHAKTWKPNMMIPVEDPRSWTHLMEFIRDIVFPSGTLRLFSVRIVEGGVQKKIDNLVARLIGKEHPRDDTVTDPEVEQMEAELESLSLPVRKEGIFTTSTVVECRHFLEGISITTQVMRGMYFPPNILFLTMSSDPAKDARLEQMISIGIREHLGICVLALHPKNSLGKEVQLNVWLRRTSPNKDLAILTALQIRKNWHGHLQFLTVVENEKDREKAQLVLDTISDRARLPSRTDTLVVEGNFHEELLKAPAADLNIFGMSDHLDCDTMRRLAQTANTSCLFIKDSGEESALV